MRRKIGGRVRRDKSRVAPRVNTLRSGALSRLGLGTAHSVSAIAHLPCKSQSTWVFKQSASQALKLLLLVLAASLERSKLEVGATHEFSAAGASLRPRRKSWRSYYL